ncbi:unnamed protein product, partial [Musa acuminata var. zebrina]
SQILWTDRPGAGPPHPTGPRLLPTDVRRRRSHSRPPPQPLQLGLPVAQAPAAPRPGSAPRFVRAERCGGPAVGREGEVVVAAVGGVGEHLVGLARPHEPLRVAALVPGGAARVRVPPPRLPPVRRLDLLRPRRLCHRQRLVHGGYPHGRDPESGRSCHIEGRPINGRRERNHAGVHVLGKW